MGGNSRGQEKLCKLGTVSIPAMGGNRTRSKTTKFRTYINPRDGGQ